MGHPTISQSPGYLRNNVHSTIRLSSITEKTQICRCAACHFTGFQRICHITAYHSISYKWNDEKTYQHKAALYEISRTYRQEPSHKSINQYNGCPHCQRNFIFNAKYRSEQFTSCCQRRGCINEKKYDDRDGRDKQ